MNFYIDLIIYILAIIGIIVTNLALFENCTVKFKKKFFVLKKNNKFKRYSVKKENKKCIHFLKEMSRV